MWSGVGGWGGAADVQPSAGAGDASARGAGEKSELEQVGLVDVHDRVGLFGDGGGESVEPDGPPVKAVDQRPQQAAVALVEAERVDLKLAESSIGDGVGDHAVGADFGIVADALEKSVDDSRGAACASGEGGAAGRFELDVECASAASDDAFEFAGAVEIETLDDAEAVAQGGCEEGEAGGGADERERFDGEPQTAGGRAFADQDVEGEILHRWVEHLFDATGEAVDFVDEEDVVLTEGAENAGEVAGSLDCGTGGGAQADAHFGGDDSGEGGFAESGRPVEEDVIQRLLARARGFDGNAERFVGGGLADEFVEPGGAQRGLGGVALQIESCAEDSTAGFAFCIGGGRLVAHSRAPMMLAGIFRNEPRILAAVAASRLV